METILDIETDLAEVETEATHDYPMACCILLKRLYRPKKYHTFVSWCWHNDELREIYFSLGFGDIVGKIFAAYAAGLRSPPEVAETQPIEQQSPPAEDATCFICWENLNDGVDYDDEVIEPGQPRRPPPPSTTAPCEINPNSICCRLCPVVFHKACLYKATSLLRPNAPVVSNPQLLWISST